MSKPTDWFLDLPTLPRGVRVVLIAGLHLLLFTAAFWGAFAIRFDFDIASNYQQEIVELLPIVLTVKLLVFLSLKMFRGWWRYVSLYDVVALGRALVISSAALVLVNVFIFTPTSFPRSIYLIDFGLSFLGLAATRGSLRLVRESMRSNLAARGEAKRLLILGAGDTGETLVREINKNRNLPFRPIAFLDDDPYKHKLRIHGVPVLGSMDLIETIVSAHEIEQIIIAMPSASREQMRLIFDRAHSTQADVQILPAVESMLSGELALTQLRKVSISDLLGRAPVRLDTQSVDDFLKGQTVLVTGAAGSIGSELCRQVLRFSPAKLIMVDQAETPLFFVEREFLASQRASLNGAHRPEQLVACMADIRDKARMSAIFETHKPDVVFHAAAYKHVPLMEKNPAEAVHNNVVGTQTVADLACENNVSAFVLISTDKAVNPTSVMGATKRITELYVDSLARRQPSDGPQTKFCAVRFGNVLGSNGSVVPIFREQILRGGPITVTDAEMTRYFMTIPEAAQLVLQAGAIGRGGELFVLDMGEPVKILELAKDMIRLSGLSADDIDIVFSGVRPGEKLFEELSFDEEDLQKTRHTKIFIGNQNRGDFDSLKNTYNALIEAAHADDDIKVRQLLKRLVPSYSHPQADEKVVSIQTGKFKALAGS